MNTLLILSIKIKIVKIFLSNKKKNYKNLIILKEKKL